MWLNISLHLNFATYITRAGQISKPSVKSEQLY